MQLRAIERRLSQKIQSNEAAYLKHQREIEFLHDELIDALRQSARCREKITALKSKTEKPLILARRVFHRRNTQRFLLGLVFFLYNWALKC